MQPTGTESAYSLLKGSLPVDKAAHMAKSLSHAEITQACDDAIKETILADKKKVTAKLLQQTLSNRKAAYHQDGGNSLWPSKNEEGFSSIDHLNIDSPLKVIS